jgi:hypothetical protein
MEIRRAVFAIFVIIISVGVITSNAEAEEIFGFEFGVLYYAHLNDDEFDGSANTFSLILPLNKGLSVAFYTEDGYVDSDGQMSDINIKELRAHKHLGSNASVFIGAGNADVSGSLITQASASVTDIGIRLNPVIEENENPRVRLGADFIYRVLEIENPPWMTPDSYDLGGFIAGIHFSAFF